MVQKTNFIILFIFVCICNTISSNKTDTFYTKTYLSYKPEQSDDTLKKLMVQIALDTLCKMNIDTSNRILSYDTNNNQWERYVVKMKKIKWVGIDTPHVVVKIANQFKAKKYQVLYSHYEQYRLGGTIWILIDKKTKAVLQILQEK